MAKCLAMTTSCKSDDAKGIESSLDYLTNKFNIKRYDLNEQEKLLKNRLRTNYYASGLTSSSGE